MYVMKSSTLKYGTVLYLKRNTFDSIFNLDVLVSNSPMFVQQFQYRNVLVLLKFPGVPTLEVGVSSRPILVCSCRKKYAAEFYAAIPPLDKIAFRVYCTMNCSILC